MYRYIDNYFFAAKWADSISSLNTKNVIRTLNWSSNGGSCSKREETPILLLYLFEITVNNYVFTVYVLHSLRKHIFFLNNQNYLLFLFFFPIQTLLRIPFFEKKRNQSRAIIHHNIPTLHTSLIY